jgi:hypothetical protein
MKLSLTQTSILGSFMAFIFCTLFITGLEVDPLRSFEIEIKDIREYIVIRKSRMTKLERTGEAEWLNQ